MIFDWINRYYRLWRWQRRVPKIYHQPLRLCAKLYAQVDGYSLSLESRSHLPEDQKQELTYGECPWVSALTCLLWADIQPTDVFLDIGSGVGQVVVMASLCFPLKKAIGVELLEPLYRVSCDIQQHLRQFESKKADAIEFYQQDALSFDCHSCNVVFINATCFFPDSWALLVDKLKQMKSGSKIIISSKGLPSDEFECIKKDQLPMSWGLSLVSLYVKK